MKRVVVLFGKTYAWVRASQTGQWRLLPATDATCVQVWSDPEYDVRSDFERLTQKPSS